MDFGIHATMKRTGRFVFVRMVLDLVGGVLLDDVLVYTDEMGLGY